MTYQRLTTSCIAIATILASSPVAAQAVAQQTGPVAADGSSAPVAAPGDIVVTAQRRSESINRVPSSIQAFTGDTLRNSGVSDAASLTQLTAGLNFAKSGSNTPIYTLRGVGFNTPNLSSTSPVGIYADEVAYAYPYMSNGPIFDLQRVEVLKGPQGTLYGRNTTGGLINFIAAKPTSSFDARAATEIGNYGTHNFEGFLSGPITPTLGLRVSGRLEDSDRGWQHSISRDDTLGKKNKLGLRAVADWKPTDRLSIELIGNYWRDRSDTVAGQAVRIVPNQPGFVLPGVADEVRTNWTSSEADWDPVSATQAPFKVHSDFYSISGRIKYALDSHLSIVSLTAYNDLKRHDVNDVDGTQYQVFGYTADGRIKSFSEETRLVGEFDRLNFTAGGYYSRDKVSDHQFGVDGDMSAIRFLRFFAQNVVDPTNQQYTASQYANGFGDFTLNLDEVSRTLSAFGNATYKVTDKVSVTGGLRYTDDHLSAYGCSRDVDGTAPPIWNTSVAALVDLLTGHFPPNKIVPGGCVGYNATFTGALDPNLPPLKENNLAGRLSTQYVADNGNLYYASANRGYKSGAFPLVPTNNASQLTPAKQERVMAFETGAKTNFFDHQLQLNVAGFYYGYKNKQLFSEVPDIVFTTLTRIVNIPRSQVYGGELEGVWQTHSGFNARFGVAYTGTRVLEYHGYDRAGEALNFRGQHFANTPKWQINGGVGYNGVLTDALGLRANINANYQSRTSSSLLNEAGFEVKAYTTVNGNVTIVSNKAGWEIGVFAKNLFNKYYWTSVQYDADVVNRIPAMPRTFGMTLAWNFK